MTSANSINVKQRRLVNFNAFQGSTFNHRTYPKSSGNNRRRLDRRANFKSQAH
jgi:hypothetical protein